MIAAILIRKRDPHSRHVPFIEVDFSHIIITVGMCHSPVQCPSPPKKRARRRNRRRHNIYAYNCIP